MATEGDRYSKLGRALRDTVYVLDEKAPFIRDCAEGDSALEGQLSCHVQWGEKMTQGMVLLGAREQYSRELGQGIGWSATGRCKLQC